MTVICGMEHVTPCNTNIREESHLVCTDVLVFETKPHFCIHRKMFWEYRLMWCHQENNFSFGWYFTFNLVRFYVNLPSHSSRMLFTEVLSCAVIRILLAGMLKTMKNNWWWLITFSKILICCKKNILKCFAASLLVFIHFLVDRCSCY